MKERGEIRIGTSGWHYAHWKGPFYPGDMATTKFLGYYITRFDTVEINNTFYQMPKPEKLIVWRDAVPKGFLFSVKANRFITHMKKLRDAARPLGDFLDAVDVLGDRLGPVLFQLPPRWGPNPERLNSFLDMVPKGVRCTFEFRDPRWLNDEIYSILIAHGVALCIHDYEGVTAPLKVTADFVYVRLHGPEAMAYTGGYSPQALSAWAKRMVQWSSDGLDVYCYFDNDEAGHAALDAEALKRYVMKKG